MKKTDIIEEFKRNHPEGAGTPTDGDKISSLIDVSDFDSDATAFSCASDRIVATSDGDPKEARPVRNVVARPRKRVGRNFIVTLAIFAFVGLSCYAFAGAPTGAYNPFDFVNIFDYLIGGGESSIIPIIYGKIVSLNAETFNIVADSIELFALIVTALLAIFYAVFCVYAIIAALIGLFASRTGRLYSIFAKVVSKCVQIILFAVLIDLASVGGEEIFVFISGFGPGIGVLSTAALGVVLLIIFCAAERRKAFRWGVSYEKLDRNGNLFRAFFGHLLISIAAGFLSISVFVVGGVVFVNEFIAGTFSGSGAASFEPFVLLDAFLFVFFAVSSLIVSSKAIKGLYHSASFSLAVNDPDPLISDAGLNELAKKRSKLSCGFIKYTVLSLLTVGGMVFLAFFQSAYYDASSIFDASALLRYVLVFGVIMVVSILFQILSHRRVR